MADFKIKSAAGTGNKTLIQGQDQSGSNYAIQIGDGGASTLHNATITAGTFPAGHVLQVQHSYAVSNQLSVTQTGDFTATGNSYYTFPWGTEIKPSHAFPIYSDYGARMPFKKGETNERAKNIHRIIFI